MITRSIFLIVLALAALTCSAEPLYVRLVNISTVSCYVEFNVPAPWYRLPPGGSVIANIYEMTSEFDLGVYVEDGNGGAQFHPGILTVGPGGYNYLDIYLQSASQVYAIPRERHWPSDWGPEPILPDNVVTVFVWGIALAATIRIFRAGLRWTKRAAADSSGSGE